MKTVNYREYMNELDRVNEQLGRFGQRNFALYDMGGFCGSDRPIEIGVNWAACGTKSVEDTLKFADDLKKACEVAKNFKYNGYTVEY